MSDSVKVKKSVVKTANAPTPIGAYSQAVKVGDLVFTSGQIAMDPATGELVGGGIMEQTMRVMENLKAILEAAGSSMEDVIKTSIFLVDMADFTDMNSVYSGYFPPGTEPARTTVQAVQLPKGAMVEIDVIAKA